MEREYINWRSQALDRRMEMLIFGHAGAKVLVFPTRGGRFHEYEDLRITEALGEKLRRGQLQLFCVDSVDAESFFCWWAHPSGRIQRHLQYERYLLDEVLPFMAEHNPHECLIAHGCSFGAYHAVNFAFRHPWLFKKVAAFSGRYDPTLQVAEFNDLFDGYYSDEVYFHTPSHYLPNLECPELIAELRRLDIVLVVGEEDPFRENNEHLSSVLSAKGIPHQFYLWAERAHRGYYWRRMAPLYL